MRYHNSKNVTFFTRSELAILKQSIENAVYNSMSVYTYNVGIYLKNRYSRICSQNIKSISTCKHHANGLK